MPETVLLIDSIFQKPLAINPANFAVSELLRRGFQVVHISNFGESSSNSDLINAWGLKIDDSIPYYLRVSIGSFEKKPEGTLYKIFTWAVHFFNSSQILLIHSIGDKWDQSLASTLSHHMKSLWVNTSIDGFFISTSAKSMQHTVNDISWIETDAVVNKGEMDGIDVDHDLVLVLPGLKESVPPLNNTHPFKKILLLSYTETQHNYPDNHLSYQPENLKEFFILIEMASKIVVPNGGSWLLPSQMTPEILKKIEYSRKSSNKKVCLSELYDSTLKKNL